MKAGRTLTLFALGLMTLRFSQAQVSTFDVDAEGWLASGFSGGYALPPYGQTPAQYGSNIGIPGGGIILYDHYSETFAGAPAKFLGNKSAHFGKSLSFDTWVTYTDAIEYPTVILAGAGSGLYYMDGFLTTGNWHHVVIPLSPSAKWHYGHPSGPEPSEAQFQAVLADLTGLYIQTEWMTGPDETYLDNIKFGDSASNTGRVILADWMGTHQSVSCLLEFRQAGITVATRNVNLQSDGSFDLSDLPAAGTYDILVKASHWLSALNPGINVSSTSFLDLDSGPNGDIDGDDAVTVFDYAVLSDYFDRDSSGSDWLTVGGNGFRPYDADLDGDDAVTVFDYAALSDNFDRMGDG